VSHRRKAPPSPPRPRRPLRYYVNRLFTLWLPLALFLIFTLGPFYYMIVISLKVQHIAFNEPSINPFCAFHPNLNQYIDLFARTQFPRWALNTIVVASLSTLVSLTFGTLAGYALARLAEVPGLPAFGPTDLPSAAASSPSPSGTSTRTTWPRSCAKLLMTPSRRAMRHTPLRFADSTKLRRHVGRSSGNPR